MDSEHTILVTGAGGFIGGWLVEMIHLGGVARVRAGVRSWAGAARLGRLPLDVILCDVLDPAQIAEALAGVDCVIHCAYGSEQVTVQGTMNMLAAARRAGTGRFVYISTTEVYGHASGHVDESHPLRTNLSAYGDAKVAAEEACWEYQRQGLPLTVIRPSIVYGPFGRTWTVDLAARLLSGRWDLLAGQGEGICNLVYVADLARAILLAARHPAAVGQAFNVRGPEPLTWNQYFARYNAALRLPELGVRPPSAARRRALLLTPVRGLGKVALAHFRSPLKTISQRSSPVRRLLKSVETSLKTTPRLVDLSLYSRQAHYPATRAKTLLGWQPRHSVAEGLDLTVRWLDQVGLLERVGPEI